MYFIVYYKSNYNLVLQAMYNIPTKVDGISTLPASEFNSLVNELKNAITTSGQNLSGSDAQQVAKSMADYVINGNFFTDSGTANAYVLTVVGNKVAPTAYADGFIVYYLVGNTNTGASTVNVSGLGIKNIKKDNGSQDVGAGDLTQNKLVQLIYDSSNDCFNLFATEFVAADYLNRNVTNNITVGYTTTAENLGNSGTGTVTPLISTGSIKTLTINGSFTLAAPTDTESGYIEIEATNDGVGGYSITLTAYTQISGTYKADASAVNLFRISKVGTNCYLEIVQPAS